MKQKALKCPEAASAIPEKKPPDCTMFWSEPFSFNRFSAAESVIMLGVTAHEDTCTPQFSAVVNQPTMFYF